MAENQNIHNEVKSFVEKMLLELKNNKNDIDITSFIQDSLLRITQEFTSEEYSFNLAMDVFVEAAYKDLSECLKEILDKTDFEEADDDTLTTCFAALYALSLIYKKQDDIEGLKELIDKKYSVFSGFPLYCEVHSRYYKRVDDFKSALKYDKRAINILARKEITNIAICISYASTVCTMLRKKNSQLTEGNIELAQKYIEDAIAFNPNYPKYYFLKAQLIFLSALRSKCELSELETVAEEAGSLIDEYADVLHYEFYRDMNRYKKDAANYEEFKDYIDEVIRRKRNPSFVKSHEELELLKEKILASKNQDVCVSSSFLPPVPALHEDDKYFFVCYSSKDFKSVYCDLIELYKHKVPFRYDERLTHGVGWQEQIRAGISNENCVGVVFYLSENILSTSAVCEEIEITKEFGKTNFCVNLEGSKIPSHILCDILIENYKKDQINYAIPGEHMRLFLNFFEDNKVFSHKFRENRDEGTNHMEAFINAIAGAFEQLVIGD